MMRVFMSRSPLGQSRSRLRGQIPIRRSCQACSALATSKTRGNDAAASEVQGGEDMIPFQPTDRHTVIPRIITADAAGLVDFLKAVLDAEGDHRHDRPSELTIGDSVVMISDGGGLRAQAPAFLYVYVPDID